MRRVQRLSQHTKVDTPLRYDDNRADLQGEVPHLLAERIDAEELPPCL
jgi:hypothetical protein